MPFAYKNEKYYYAKVRLGCVKQLLYALYDLDNSNSLYQGLIEEINDVEVKYNLL